MALVAWGLIHAIFQIIGDVKAKIGSRFEQDDLNNSISKRIRKGVITFVLVDFAWVFFAADSIHMALGIFKQMLTRVITTSVFKIGLDKCNWIIMILSIVILITVDLFHERGLSIKKIINSQEIWFRLIVYNFLLWAVIMLGIYGVGYDTSQFIYFQF